MKRVNQLLLWACLIGLVSGSTIFAGMVPDHVVVVEVKRIDSVPEIQRMLHQSGSANSNRTLSALSAEDSGYRLVICNREGGFLYETKLTFPVSMTIPPSSPVEPEDRIPAVLSLDTPVTTVIVPYFTDADTVMITAANDAAPISIKSMDLAVNLSTPELSSAPRPAPAEEGKFHVLIMASGYRSGTFIAFQSQAEKIKSGILGVEPFKSQTAKVDVHTYSNTADIGCYTGCYNIDRLLCCDQTKVVSAATASGYLFDEIIVVHNTGVYAGGGYRENLDAYKINSYNSYCAVYDGNYSADMAIHEFGHSFGNLCDEYSYGTEGYQYSPCVNCMANCSQYPTASACQLGCDAKSTYYRPDTSIMYDYANPFFNDASILAEYSPDGLKKRLNFFTASSSQAVLSVTPASRSVSKDSGTTTFAVSNTGTGTMPWTAAVISGSGWLSIASGASGTDSGTIGCKFTANTDSQSRTGTIRVTAAGASGSPMDVTVNQAGTSSLISVKFLGAWPDGVYSWHQPTRQWTKIPSTAGASMIAAGKVNTDTIDDLIGVWSSGLYVRQSSNGQWVKLGTTLPTWITAGDLNNDGLDEVIGTWKNDGVYSWSAIDGKWNRITTAAMQLASGKIGGVRDDLAGVWNDGVWVRYSAGSLWEKIDSAIPRWITTGDMTGDNRADIVASYTSGTWYRNSVNGVWTKFTTPAEQLAAGDLDGDGRDDLIGVWSNGVWIRYGSDGHWQQITTSRPTWITTGRID